MIDDYYKLNKELKSFSDITDNEFKILTDFLLQNDFVEEIDGEYIVGSNAEKLMTMGSFYNQFVIKKSYKVQTDKQTIGEIELGENLRVADRIYLSGQVWKIEAINHKLRKIRVSLSSKANAKSFASSGGFEISGEVRDEMEKILLNPSSLEITGNIKEVIDELSGEITNEAYHFIETDGRKALRTFKSTKINKTLALMLNIKTKSLDYYVEDKATTVFGPNLIKAFNSLRENPLSINDIAEFFNENPKEIDGFVSLNKFMNLVPKELKITYIIENALNIDGANEYLQNL